MAKYELELRPDVEGDAETVALDTSITLYQFQQFQSEGLIDKKFLTNLMTANSDPAKADLSDMMNAPYMAYRNANKHGMTKEEFEARVPMDLDMCATLYSDIVGGDSAGEMANSFRKVTKKK